MRHHTTRKDIEAQLLELNRLLGRPERPWVIGKVHGNAANVGNIHLYRDHLGYKIYEMVNTGGGVRDVTYKDLPTRRAVSLWLDGAIYSSQRLNEKNAPQA